MEIVIKIPEEVYKRVVVSPRCTPVLDAFEDRDLFVKALQNGTPLPEGHGRLIDADAFIKAECSQCDGNCGVCDCDCLNCKSEWRCEFIKDIDSADVIVEADKEVDE